MNQQFKNTSKSWGLISRLLHWVMAVIIIGALYAGLTMVDMAASPEKFELYALHKSFGVLILILVMLRLAWRYANVIPTLPTQDLASRLSAPVLYLAMLLMPISGIAMSQAGGHPVSFFGWFTLPAFIAKNPELGKFAKQIHGYTGKILIGLICLHATAALYHHFVIKNNLLRRMSKGY
jgi:cytochrome b561